MNRKEELYPEAIRLVTDSDIWSISDLITFLPIGKSTFYEYYPAHSDEMEAIKKRIDQNRIKIKLDLRKRLFDSDSPTAIIAAYKLVCSKEEFQRLSNRISLEDEIEDDNQIHVTIDVGKPEDYRRNNDENTQN